MQSTRTSALAIACAFSLGLGILPTSTAQAATPYLGAQGGVYFWPLYSNRNQVEADTAPGYSWGVVGGVEFDADSWFFEATRISHLSRRFGGRVELEVGQRFSRLHGVNDEFGQRTADGKKLRATSAQVNLWPSVKISDHWTYYLGGGVGLSWLQLLGSDKDVTSFVAGTGVLIALPVANHRLRLDLGWRSFFARSAEYRDRLTDFNAHGMNLGIQFTF